MISLKFLPQSLPSPLLLLPLYFCHLSHELVDNQREGGGVREVDRVRLGVSCNSWQHRDEFEPI